MHAFVTTAGGFESALKEEVDENAARYGLTLHGGECIEGSAGVYCAGGWDLVAGLNLSLSCASRVLWVLGEGDVETAEDIYRAARSIDWTALFDGRQATFAVSASLNKSFITNSHFLSLKIKDAIVDAFRDKTGSRPNVDTERPDVRIFVRLHANTMSLAVDTTGEPLSNRHYRKGRGEAPLRESTAACLLRLTGWNRLVQGLWEAPDKPVYFERAPQPVAPIQGGAFSSYEKENEKVKEKLASPDAGKKTGGAQQLPTRVLLSPYLTDPMCGSGTLGIEAALALLCRKPNARRESFAFLTLPPALAAGADSAYARMRKQVLAGEKGVAETLVALERYAEANGIERNGQNDEDDIFVPLRATDIDMRALEQARENAKAAGVSRLITFSRQDISKVRPHASHGLVLVNPPYGERMGDTLDMPVLYKSMGDLWKAHFPHWTVWLLSANMEALKSVGLRATRNVAVYNGSLECRFAQFVMVPKGVP